ncbi:hypothetical protein SORBI_3004G198350 [Sorghum bicolor]|uniref:Uncharacterized protein n=1 Tax=Sorghum bicolor TaxID=4558 RepID=A0A1Z5RNA7_SORBI|nr:hypothetical protein SORBI_3004G198350 [Sorghum bicolor]
MAPLASMLARVAREASARSRLALPAAACSGEACGDLILGNRLLAAVRPHINLTGDASKRQLFGCAQHIRRSFCTNSSSARIFFYSLLFPTLFHL